MKFDRTLGAIALTAMLSSATAHAQDTSTTRVFPTDLTNIAAAQNGGRVLASSSSLDNKAEFGAANLIDGQVFNPTSKTGTAGWISNRFDPVNMDTVTFGFRDNELRNIGKIVLTPATSATPERWAKDVEVQVSTESAEGPYTAVQQLTLKRSPEPQEFIILPTKARFVRLMFRSNWGSDRAVALGEVEMYEAINTADSMGSVIARLEGAIKDLNSFNASQREIGGMARSASTPMPQNPLRQTSTRIAQAEGKPAASAGGNIAAAANGGRIVDVTSTFNEDKTYSANNLIDGRNFSLADNRGSAGWASQGFAPGRQWVTIGFRDDRTRLISRVTVNPVSSQSSLRWASRIEIQVTTGSPTEGPWRTVESINIRGEAANQDFDIRPTEAKYVRFVFAANGPGNPSPLGDPNVSSDRSVALGEIEIYEPVAATNDLSPLIGRFNQVLIDLKRLRGQNPALNTTTFSAPTGRVQTVSQARVKQNTAPRKVAKTKK